MRTGSQLIDPAPPDIHDGGGGGGWAWLVTTQGIIEAELVRGVLEGAGIVPVALDTHDPSPGAWMFLSGNPNALVRVLVPASLLDAARLALLDAGLDEPEPDQEEERGVARAWRWWVWTVLAALVVALLLVATMHGTVTG